MSKCGCNEVLAVLSGKPQTADVICAAIDESAACEAHSPLRRRVLKALGRLRDRGLITTVVVEAEGPSRKGAVAQPLSATGYRLTAEGIDFLVRGGRVPCGGEKGKSKPPRVQANTFRERLWRALRIKKRGTIPELIAAARRDSDPEDCTRNARGYLDALERAGIVFGQGRKNRRIRARGFAPTSNGFITFILRKDLGPKAPSVRKAGIYDPNGDGQTIKWSEASNA